MMRYSFAQIEALQLRIDALQKEMNGKLGDLKSSILSLIHI